MSTAIHSNLQDLVVQLHRGNGSQAELLIRDVSAELAAILQTGEDPETAPMRRAQQTMFAVDEARLLLAQQDLEGALEAARDASREWRQTQPR